MSRIIVASVAAATLAFGGSLVAQSGVQELTYSSVDVLKTPKDVYVGEVAGVGANSKGEIYVYTRTGHPYATLGDNRTFSHGGSRLFVFDRSGNFVREWGQDVYGFNAAIGLRVDPQDNVWTIDVAANQVVKFNADGSIGLVLGRKPEAIGVRPNAPPPAVRRLQRRRRAGARCGRWCWRAGGGARWRWRRFGGGQAGRAPGSGIPGSGFSPSDRCRVGQGRQHLRR